MRVLDRESGDVTEMAETYTREDLGKLKRSELRALATSDKVGMTCQEASAARSETMIDIILKKLGGAGAKKGAPAPRGRPPGKPAPAPEPEPEETPVEGAEDPEEGSGEATSEEAPEKKRNGKSLKEENTVIQRLDAIGPAVEELGTSAENMTEKLSAIQKQLYVVLSLLKLSLGTNMEPEDVDKAIDDASTEFDGGEGKE